MKKHKAKLDPKYKKVWGIYKIVNILNNKMYFGSSKNLYRRLNDHFSELRNGNHYNKHLQYAFNKYKENNFKAFVVKTFSTNEITEKDLRNIETTYIQTYKTYDPKIGYNISRVGKGTSSEEFTEERKHKISISNKGKIPPNKGIPMSKEQRELLTKINVEKRGKPILMYDIFGDFIKRYESISEAAKDNNTNKNNISRVCHGKSGIYKNKIFRFEGTYDFGEKYFLNKYTKNISYDTPFYFEIKNLITGEIYKCVGKRDLEIHLKIPNRDKKLQKLVKFLYSREKDEIIYKNCSIKFNYALSNRDITKELRQPDDKIFGVS